MWFQVEAIILELESLQKKVDDLENKKTKESRPKVATSYQQESFEVEESESELDDPVMDPSWGKTPLAKQGRG